MTSKEIIDDFMDRYNEERGVSFVHGEGTKKGKKINISFMQLSSEYVNELDTYQKDVYQFSITGFSRQGVADVDAEKNYFIDFIRKSFDGGYRVVLQSPYSIPATLVDDIKVYTVNVGFIHSMKFQDKPALEINYNIG